MLLLLMTPLGAPAPHQELRCSRPAGIGSDKRMCRPLGMQAMAPAAAEGARPWPPISHPVPTSQRSAKKAPGSSLGILREETGGSTCRPVNLALHCHALSLCR